MSVTVQFSIFFPVCNLRSARLEATETIILCLVLYECETWSLALREEQTEDVENGMLRRIYGPKYCEETGDYKNCIMWSFRTLKSSPCS
jgi:hypothetical protein